MKLKSRRYVKLSLFIISLMILYSCSGDTTVVKKRPQKIVINTYELNFSSVLLSQTKTLEIGVSNVGDFPLDLITLTITPQNSPFNINQTSIRRIDTGKTEKFTITFAPKSEGMHNASLNIVTNDPENEVAIVKLLGIGSNENSSHYEDGGDTAADDDISDNNKQDNDLTSLDDFVQTNEDSDNQQVFDCLKLNEKKVITVQNVIREIDSVWFKNELMIAWRDEDQNVYLLPMPSTGQTNESDIISVKTGGNPVSNVRISSGDNTVAIMYEESVNSEYQVQLSIIENKSLKTTKTITSYTSSFQDPPIIWTDDSYAVAWHYTKEGNKNVFLSLLDENGNITKDMMNVTHLQNPMIANFPTIGYGNASFFMLYSAYDGTAYYPVPDLYLIKGDKNLQFQSPIKKPPIKNKLVGSDRHLVWSGKELGFFWSETELHSTSTTHFTKQYYFQLLDENGMNIIEPILLEDLSDKNADYAKMTYNGSDFGIAYKIEDSIMLRMVDTQLKIANTEYIVANFNDTLESVDIESAKQNDFTVLWLMKDTSGKKQIYISRICK